MPMSAKVRKAVATAVVPLAVVGATAVVFQSSYAAFTGSTSAQTTFNAGAVSLTNSAVSTPFATSKLVPGAAQQYWCVAVTYTGTVTANLRFYLTGYTPTNGVNSGNNLEDDMQLIVSRNDGDLTSTCDSWTTTTFVALGTAKALSAKNSWDTGYEVANVAPGTIMTYRVAYRLPDLGVVSGVGGNNGDMNDAVSMNLTWEARSTV